MYIAQGEGPARRKRRGAKERALAAPSDGAAPRPAQEYAIIRMYNIYIYIHTYIYIYIYTHTYTHYYY